MKKSFLTFALCALTMAANATTYNYLCAITEISVDTLASTKKNQYTLNWTQKCKNTAEYDSKPEGTYTTTVKLVINSDDRTLEGTYTTVGADPNSSSANVNDQTINLVTSELYYGNTRRLLRTDSVSTFTIIKIDDSHYAISEGRLCFTAAALADRGKHTYNYNYCYAEEEILQKGISPTPFVFGFSGSGEYQQKVSNYDMSVNGISVEHSKTDYGVQRYFLTLNCSGTNRETGKSHDYEVQLAIYPSEESIVGSFATQKSTEILMATNSYVKDLNISKLRYLCNDSLSTIQIKSKGVNQYSFFGGTLTCVDLDANYSAVYGKKRVEEVHYYHFSDNDGEGIEFGWDEDSNEMELIPSKVTVNTQIDGFQLVVDAKNDKGISYSVNIEFFSEHLDGTYSIANELLSAWSKVEHGSNSSYVTNGATVTINKKNANTFTLSGNLLCENENTYILKAFDFEYGTATGVEHLQENKAQCAKVLRDGVIVIEREGKEFNMLGTPVVR